MDTNRKLLSAHPPERIRLSGQTKRKLRSKVAQLGNLGIVSVSYWEWIKLVVQSVLLSMAITVTVAFAIWWITK
jgi:hypothetical protein